MGVRVILSLPAPFYSIYCFLFISFVLLSVLSGFAGQSHYILYTQHIREFCTELKLEMMVGYRVYIA